MLACCHRPLAALRAPLAASRLPARRPRLVVRASSRADDGKRPRRPDEEVPPPPPPAPRPRPAAGQPSSSNSRQQQPSSGSSSSRQQQQKQQGRGRSKSRDRGWQRPRSNSRSSQRRYRIDHALNNALKEASSCQEVLRLVPQTASCGVIELTTAVNRMAKLHRQQKDRKAGPSQLEAKQAAFRALLAIAFEQLGNFDAVACAQHLYAAAWLEVAFSRQQQEDWEQQTMRVLQGAKPQEVSNIVWALGTLSERGQAQLGDSLPGALRKALPKALESSKPQNVSNIIWGFGKLGWQPSAAELQAALAAVRQEAPNMIPQALANVSWAWADGGWPLSKELFAALRPELPRLWREGNAQVVANTVWGASEMGWQLRAAEVEGALAAGERRAAEMIPKQLSMTIRAWAHAGWQGSGRLFKALRPELPRVWLDGEPQPLAVSVWGASELKWQLAESELEEALAAVERRAAKMIPQQLSMTIRAWAHAGWSGIGRLFAALRPELPRLWEDGEPQHVAVSLWGASELKWQLAESDLEEALAAVERRAAKMIPQQLSMIIRAWAHAGWPASNKLFAALRPDLLRLWADGDSQAVAVSLWGASEMGWQLSAAELEEALAAVERRAAKMTSQELAMTVRAWAHAGWPGSNKLFGALRPQLPQLFEEGDAQSVAVSLRRASQLEWQLGELADAVNAALLRELPCMPVEGVTNVRQVFGNEEWRPWLSEAAEAALEAAEGRLGLGKQQPS